MVTAEREITWQFSSMKTEEITAITFLAYFSDHFTADCGQQCDLVMQYGVSWDLDGEPRVHNTKLDVVVVAVNASPPST